MKRTRPLNEQKRQAIVEAAISEFSRVGYDAASMDTISNSAKVSKATVYKHFGSKQNLFMSLILTLKQTFDAYHFIEYNPEIPVERQLVKFARREMEMVCNPKNLTLFRIAINVLMNECEVTESVQAIANDYWFDNLLDWFQKAKADGALHFADEEAEFVVQQFVGNIKSFAFYTQLYGAPPLDVELYDKVVHNAVKIITMLYSTPPAPSEAVEESAEAF